MGRPKKDKNDLKWNYNAILCYVKDRHKKRLSLAPKDNMLVYNEARKFDGAWEGFLKKIGLDYEKIGIVRRPKVTISTRDLLDELRAMGKVNSYYVFLHNKLLHSRLKRRLGSWKNVVTALGVNYDDIKGYWDVDAWLQTLDKKKIEELTNRVEKLNNGGKK